MADKDKDNDEVEATIADEAVVIKYKTAGEIANRKLVYSVLMIHTFWKSCAHSLDNRSLTFLPAFHDSWLLDLTYKTSRVPGRVVARKLTSSPSVFAEIFNSFRKRWRSPWKTIYISWEHVTHKTWQEIPHPIVSYLHPVLGLL